MEHTIELKYGHTDANGVKHTTVTFGKRLTGEGLMAIDGDPQAQSRTQYVDLIRRRAMTKFGTLPMPPPLNTLLKLNKIDRDDISTAFEEFQRTSRGDRTSEFRKDNVVKLFFGFKVGDTEYPVVEMNRLTTGMDEVEADSRELEGVSRECFMLGKMVSRISTDDDTPLSIEGPLDLELFKALDADDISLLRKGAHLAEIFFRITGGQVSEEQESDNATPDEQGNGDERSGAVEASKTAAG